MASQQDLLELINAALKAAEQAETGSQAEEARALDILKRLLKFPVTTELLRSTEGGKKINKLKKHSSSKISLSAASVVDTWKDCVRQEAEQGNDAGPKSPLDAPPASVRNAAPEKSNPNPNPSSSAPSKPSQKPRSCGDSMRDKLREEFAKALEAAVPDVPGGDPCSTAVQIEEAMFALSNHKADAKYKAKFRTLIYNLKDANNPDLRRKVLEGSIPAARMVDMSAEELASDARKQENQKLREVMKKEAERGGTTQASTDMFQCGKCRQRKCTYWLTSRRRIRSGHGNAPSCYNIPRC